jgi:uncharacterized LabA/DUF88 family protein
VVAHAFRGHYDVAILLAGDGDYLPLVEELKREGKAVVVCFFESTGLNPRLRREADDFVNLDELFLRAWASHLSNN